MPANDLQNGDVETIRIGILLFAELEGVEWVELKEMI